MWAASRLAVAVAACLSAGSRGFYVSRILHPRCKSTASSREMAMKSSPDPPAFCAHTVFAGAIAAALLSGSLLVCPASAEGSQAVDILYSSLINKVSAQATFVAVDEDGARYSQVR
ncbi:unnamed protein product [Phaeothamnion confervicola]